MPNSTISEVWLRGIGVRLDEYSPQHYIGLDFDVCTGFWHNSHPKTIHSVFWPKFYPNTIHYIFRHHFQTNTINSDSVPNKIKINPKQ